MTFPNRAPDGGLYCIHGTFPDHCGVCMADYTNQVKAQLEAERELVRVLRSALGSIVMAYDMPNTVLALANEALATTAPEGGEVWDRAEKHLHRND